MNTPEDLHYMGHALGLARRALGRAWPNPAVGCVILGRQGIVVGRGWTGDGGRPHAETQALTQAGGAAKGATAYVSFEPCCHHGKTPPCTQALIDAGVTRVVMACEDPDPRVAGKGMAALKAAGIEVRSGVMEKEARELNAGFILRLTRSRPFVTLKLATSADGKIAPEPGKRQWITDTLARRRVHLERSLHDAILVGVGTVLADNPSLTTRLDGYDHDSVRVVFDTELRMPLDSQLVRTAGETPLFVFYNSAKAERVQALEEKGVRLFKIDPHDLAAVLAALAAEGITRLFVEGGAKIHASFLESGLCDRFLWFCAPATIGPRGVPALAGHDIRNIGAEFGLERQKTMKLGEDLLEIYGKPA
jgi:diaminohydroxyphosphoribosylaminopyrimidine deaminase/5-amino-6-(5-phosphoribosylamino)uracil reductase